MNLKSISLIKIDFINCAGDVAKSRESDQIAIVDPGRGDVAPRGALDRTIKLRSSIVT